MTQPSLTANRLWMSGARVAPTASLPNRGQPGCGALGEQEGQVSPNARRRILPPAQRGFTLIELTMVLALIAIMVALIIPEMKGTFEAELLRANGRKLVRAFNLAYAQTVTLHQRHRLRLDVPGKRFLLERPATKEDQHSGFVPVLDLPGAEGTIDDRISAVMQNASTSFVIKENPNATPPQTTEPQDAPDTITFYPDGTAQAKEIVLEDRDGFRLAIRINPITARVRAVELKRP